MYLYLKSINITTCGSVGSRESSGSGGSGRRDKPPPSALNQVTDMDDVMAEQEAGKEEMKGKGYSDLEASREVSVTCVYVAHSKYAPPVHVLCY